MTFNELSRARDRVIRDCLAHGINPEKIVRYMVFGEKFPEIPTLLVRAQERLLESLDV